MNYRAGFDRAGWTAAAFFVLACLAGFSVCHADDFGDVYVTADAMYTGNTYHGYAARRITLENRSDKQSHVVSLNYPEMPFSNYGSSLSRLSRTVTLPPGAREFVTLLQPPLPIYGNDAIGVEIDGGHAGEVRAPNSNSHCSNTYSYGRAKPAVAFISRDLDFDAVSRDLTATMPASSFSYTPSGENNVEGLRAEVPANQWSSDWLAYTPFDVVVVGSTDLTIMSPETTEALRSYVDAGGSLIVFGKSGVPEQWLAKNGESLKIGTKYTEGLGAVFVLNSPNPSLKDPETIATLRNYVVDKSRYWQTLPLDNRSINDSLKLVETLQVPTRGIISVMLLFVVAIGPVNIVLLTRRNRRTWMLWTIPAISLLTTVLVFAYSLLREGFTPTVRITGLTVLDQSTHHADTIGAEGIYCPLTPSGGLHFDAETEVTPLINVDYGSGASREVDWSQAQHLTSGWVASRVPAFFHLRKSETCRDRVQIENRDGELRVLNGLGAPIKSFWYADAQMRIYSAQDVAAGSSAQLVASPASSTGHAGPVNLFHDIGFFANFAWLHSSAAANYLTPDTYIADLDSNPFIENGLGPGANQKLTQTSAVVFGILDPADRL